MWAATDVWSNRVLNQLLQPLYIRDPKTLKLIPWLAAEDPVYDPATLSYTVRLRKFKMVGRIRIYLPGCGLYGGTSIKTFRIPRFISNWEFIQKMETPDKQTVRFFLKEPKALFLSRTLTTPMVQRKKWGPVMARAEKSAKPPFAFLLKENVIQPVGNGPFVFKEWEKGKHLLLEKNDLFFRHRKADFRIHTGAFRGRHSIPVHEQHGQRRPGPVYGQHRHVLVGIAGKLHP